MGLKAFSELQNRVSAMCIRAPGHSLGRTLPKLREEFAGLGIAFAGLRQHWIGIPSVKCRPQVVFEAYMRLIKLLDEAEWLKKLVDWMIVDAGRGAMALIGFGR